MRTHTYKKALATALAMSVGLLATPLAAADSFKVGVVAYLTGPGAGPFGIPGHNGAQLLIDAINAGEMPEPYNKPGFGGKPLEAIYTDESGGNAKQVAEYRNLVEKQGVDVVLGYTSSGSCLSVAPVADELKTLTIMSVCGSPRLFEEKARSHVFRTIGTITGDSVAAARYALEKFPDSTGYTGINQNYAGGQDAYNYFDLSMKALSAEVKGSDKPQFPKIFSGQYGTEISTLLLDKAELVHISLWGGDMEAFALQAGIRGFFAKKKAVVTVGAAAIDSLGQKFPEGLAVGTRGENGILVRQNTDPLNAWFIEAYKERYGAYPVSPSYQYAASVLALKFAMDKAAEEAGGTPSKDQILTALKGQTFPSLAGDISFAQSNGHQAVHPVGYGMTVRDEATGEIVMQDVKFYPPSCIFPPDGVASVDWIKSGLSTSDC